MFLFPWRWITQLLLLLVAWRVARSRRSGQPVVNAEAVKSRVAAAMEPVGIAGHLVVIAVVACVCAALLIAGVTALVLSPRWLGGTLVGVAAICALAAVPEVRRVRRTLRARRLRLRDSAVTRELDAGGPH